MLGAVYFLSGATGLVYEVVWAKYLAALFGATALAQTTVLAVFLGGLALGSAWLGPLADRSDDPLRLYGRLELGLALAGLIPPFALPLAASAGPARVLIAAAILLVPTVLMGATLPALGRHLARRGEDVGRAASRLYAVNSAGAVAGCLAAGYFMIPRLGLDLSTALAAAGNAVCGLGAMALARKARGGRPRDASPSPARPLGEDLKRLLWAAAFVGGFVALCYEIAWVRVIALVLGSSAYSFSAMLAGFIAGIALGASLARRRWVSRAPPYLAFGLAELAAAAVMALTVPFYDKLPYVVLLAGGFFNRIPATFYIFEGVKLALCLALMIVPTALIGMTLPLAASALSRPERAGRDLGRLWGFNTAGNVAGALAAGLWLLPALGLQGLFAAAAAGSLVVGVVIVWTAPAPRRVKAFAIGAALAAFAASAALPPWDKLMLTRGDFRMPMANAYPSFSRYAEQTRRQSLIFYRDGREATISVERDPIGTLSLKVNAKVDASSTGDMANQMLIAHIPLVLRPASRDVLIVGLGSGVTAGAALAHPVSRVDVVELSPEVVEAARLFAPYNRGALDDPRLTVAADDAKTFVKTSSRRYDLILSEPSNTWIAGVASLFTRDFYRDARSRLKEGGLFMQWFHLYELNDPTLQLVLRTFASEFSSVSLWETTPGRDLVIIGSDGPVVPDYRAMQAEFDEPKVRADLARLGIGKLSTLLSLQSAGDDVVRAVAGAGPFNEDRHPLLEYEAPKAFWLQRFATILRSFDQRGDARWRRRLYAWSYLRSRGRALDAAERAEWTRYHEGANPAIAQLVK